jgi:hypothetical protein
MFWFFSWEGLERKLSEKAQVLSILAAALANLIFLNQHVKFALQDFLPEASHHSSCGVLVDTTESKLLIMYLAVFSLGTAALIIRYFMPPILKIFESKQEYCEKHQNWDLKEIYLHFDENISGKLNLKRQDRLLLTALVDSTRQLSGMSGADVQSFARSYFSHYFDYSNRSFIFAPSVRLALLSAAILFGYQALKTFAAVVCLQIAVS